MKLNLGTIKNIFRRKRKVLGHRNPNRDWLRILETFAFLSIITIGLGVFLFLGIDRGLIFKNQSITEVTPTTIDRESITSVTSFYQDREDELNTLKVTPSDVVDPAL